MFAYFSHEILLNVVARDENPPFVPSALKVQILSLSTEKVGLLLRLEVLEVLLLLGQPLLLLFLWCGLVLIQFLQRM